MISPELGEARMLWAPSFSGYALDLEKSLLLVSQLELAGGESAGTYLVNVEEGSKERLGGPAEWVRRWRRQGELGLMHSSEGVLAVDASGVSRLLLEGEYGLPDPSPSGDKVAFSGYGDIEGLRVLDVETGEKMTLDVPGVTCVSWRPDGEALAFVADDALYFNDLRGNSSVLVDAALQHSYLNYVDCNVVWIEGDGG
jgi:Tol biopolymer transport system component